jgi:hypothetical protein
MTLPVARDLAPATTASRVYSTPELIRLETRVTAFQAGVGNDGSGSAS